MTFRRLATMPTNDAAALSRRDFLKCHVSKGRRVLELSCECLYMRYQDARSEAGRRQVSNHDEPARQGESSAGFAMLKPDQLLAELEHQLAGVDELRVLEREWLDRGDFGRQVGARIETFRRRGGHVKFGRPQAAAPNTNRASEA
jgi:hypothetical protein